MGHFHKLNGRQNVNAEFLAALTVMDSTYSVVVVVAVLLHLGVQAICDRI